MGGNVFKEAIPWDYDAWQRFQDEHPALELFASVVGSAQYWEPGQLKGDIDIVTFRHPRDAKVHWMPNSFTKHDANGDRRSYLWEGKYQIDLFLTDDSTFIWCSRSLMGDPTGPAWVRNILARAIAAHYDAFVINDDNGNIIGRIGWSWLITKGFVWRPRLRKRKQNGIDRVKAMAEVTLDEFNFDLGTNIKAPSGPKRIFDVLTALEYLQVMPSNGEDITEDDWNAETLAWHIRNFVPEAANTFKVMCEEEKRFDRVPPNIMEILYND